MTEFVNDPVIQVKFKFEQIEISFNAEGDLLGKPEIAQLVLRV
jgi:hypothetical protein